MSYKVYGIPNCNTVKKVLLNLDDKGIAYEFINFKKQPPVKEMIKRWEDFMGELPANKRGPTFRKIKDDWEDATKAGKIKLLLENTSAIKRPIVEKNEKVMAIGFDEAALAKIK